MRGLFLATFFLSFIVIVLGSYVRLSEAGLGCPDWPGCYGRMMVPESVLSDISRPLESGKAWKEMIHRYFAGALGLFILVITILAWVRKRQRFLATFLLLLVIFQAMLGMWTVTLLLHPLVVMGHLLGGFATLGLLWWMFLRDHPHPDPLPSREREAEKFPSPGAIVALIVLILQIALGGWTSANYAAFACPDFPTCQGDWLPQMNIKEAFHLGALGLDYEYGVLDNQGRVTIQMMHRIGAVITFLFLFYLGLKIGLKGKGGLRFFGFGLATMVTAQFGLGISNVLMFRPLPVAVAHTAVAALLVVFLVGFLKSQLVLSPRSD